MVWLVLVAAAMAALTPLALTVRREAALRGRREAALALHQAQLTELARDRKDGRLDAAEYENVKLEVQRRLLAAAAQSEPADGRSSRQPLFLALVMVPLAAFALYVAGGSPFLPDQPLAERMAAAEAQAKRDEALITQLRTQLAKVDPKTEEGRQGFILLGNAEASRSNMRAAADAWGTALASRFDPLLAMEVAEATTEAEGRVTDRARTLFARALAAAPPDAPWRRMIERRLSEAGEPRAGS
jgi:cytochrome c-type biogenesis protein CcmH